MSGVDEQRTVEASKKPQDERQMTLEDLIEHCRSKELSLIRASEMKPQKPVSDDE